MQQITFIGDVHGKVEQYKQIVDYCEFSICVGDFGFKKEWDWFDQKIHSPYYSHYINMGNHDYIPYSETHYASLRNQSYFDTFSIFTVRGADSIDKHLRTEGLDWFANEELNYLEQLEAFDMYCKYKPRIVVSHDCPQEVMKQLFGYPEKSQTRTMLQAMFDEHKPELYIFGHHHKSVNVNIFGTNFICLNELETLTIEI